MSDQTKDQFWGRHASLRRAGHHWHAPRERASSDERGWSVLIEYRPTVGTSPGEAYLSADASGKNSHFPIEAAVAAKRLDAFGRPGHREAGHQPTGSGRVDSAVGSVHLAVPDPLTPTQQATKDEHPLCGVRVVIVDDNTVYREYLAHVLAAHGSNSVAGAWDQQSLAATCAQLQPHVVLVNMATKNSDVLLRRALSLGPDARVIVIGVFDDDEAGIVAFAEAGVAGYHMRRETLNNLVHLVHRVAEGGTVFSPRVSAILLRRLSSLASERPAAQSGPDLTAREREILGMIETGMSNRDIAERLSIAVHTVKNHVHSLLKKLGVGTRAQAAAVSRGLRVEGGPLEGGRPSAW